MRRYAILSSKRASVCHDLDHGVEYSPRQDFGGQCARHVEEPAIFEHERLPDGSHAPPLGVRSNSRPLHDFVVDGTVLSYRSRGPVPAILCICSDIFRLRCSWSGGRQYCLKFSHHLDLFRQMSREEGWRIFLSKVEFDQTTLHRRHTRGNISKTLALFSCGRALFFAQKKLTNIRAECQLIFPTSERYTGLNPM